MKTEIVGNGDMFTFEGSIVFIQRQWHIPLVMDNAFRGSDNQYISFRMFVPVFQNPHIWLCDYTFSGTILRTVHNDAVHQVKLW